MINRLHNQMIFSFEPKGDFVHLAENSAISQENLDENRDHFNNKCKLVFSWLMAGSRLTVLECAIHGVASLPRRCLDLKKKGVQITTEYNERIAVYYMTPQQKEFNKKFLKP